jgi:hypothetical protein
MPESDEELGKRLFGYLTETLDKKASAVSDDKTISDATRAIRAGGPAGWKIFFILADHMYKHSGDDGLVKWVSTAFWMFPKDDQEIVLASVMKELAEKKLLLKIVE